MKRFGLPHKQGLYDPQFEHDACGMGFVAHLKGKKSNKIVHQAIEILENLTHRGAVGAEENTGDGAGILMQMPHSFFEKVFKKEGIMLPDEGNYGMAFLFLPQNVEERKKCESVFEKHVIENGLKILGWRDVPVDTSEIGKTALLCMPVMRQAIVSRDKKLAADIDYERKLYVIRKLTENEVRNSDIEEKLLFYFTSFSAKTVVYKGMLTPEQVKNYFVDLKDPELETGIAMVHSRFSTNTFPSWDRAHPNRYIIHNGEINTLRGNVNWMHAREALIKTNLYGEDINDIFPITNPNASDSGMFDNVLEFLVLSGRSLPHAVMMMIPEPWSNHEGMSQEKRDFYEYHSCMMEPWDGPASIGFTDGKLVGAVLDRNGLRPSRYYVTKDDLICLASEVGVMTVEPDQVVEKQRLQPGRMLLVDTTKGRIVTDEEIKHELATQQPYGDWLKEHLIELDKLELNCKVIDPDHETVLQRQKAFGYTYEVLTKMLVPMATKAEDPIGAMGTDSPIAVLSDKEQLLYSYFQQLFAQVTNPPIDAIREALITSAITTIGPEGDLINPTPESCQQIVLESPVIDNEQLEKLRGINVKGYKAATLPILFESMSGGKGLERAMEELFGAADKAVSEGNNLLILSDRGISEDKVAIPALMAISGVHHHLIRNGNRGKVGLILESGEPREVHHFAVLIGYGAQAINPYLAFESIDDMIKSGMIKDITHEAAVKKYIKAATKNVVKVLSKMGISTIQSYRGAQIFECIGINNDVIEKYFTRTPSRIGGIGLEEIAIEAQSRHDKGFKYFELDSESLESGSNLQWRKDGDSHIYNPESIYYLQRAVREGNYELFKKYSELFNNEKTKRFTLRGLMELNYAKKPISIDEVESVEEICKRFKTGAMSYGSIGQEAHEAIAIAMNRIGGRSNSGEGGEDPRRFVAEANGDLKCSAIKQVASGRFGVTSHYLANAKEIQIKMAQGAKPGEGGHLPGKKVYPWIGKVRGTTPGVSLISPPPHHDIYSIEDLAELIHDLKNANREARINVKLVSEVGVGTIAAGVAKGKADVILISGYDGGTGAAPKTSIRHAGLPWELGVAETHQTLVLNNLRSRVVVETDGKLMTGRDVIIAALLGAEEYGFATSVLVTLGCVMMRVCNLDTCPVGVATQNPNLRAKFTGKPEYVENFMRFIAQEIREYMAMLGFRTINEMIGRVDKINGENAINHWKAKGVDFSNVLYSPDVPDTVGRYCQIKQNHELEKSLDLTKLLDICKPALQKGEKVNAEMPIINTNRVVGTIVGNEISKKYGRDGLPEDTITLKFNGSAGQSLAAFAPKGMTFILEGDSNDYIGKGLSGAKLVVYPPKGSTFVPEENIIVGNVAFYGATGGEAYIQGVAGERFCVRNSGVQTVVEGVGDHGCEYMTGGKVVILGKTGRNFAAGMSGGVAYVYDKDGAFTGHCNTELVDLTTLSEESDINEVKTMIQKHIEYTGSAHAKDILDNFNPEKFVRVMPRDYKRIIDSIEKFKAQGMSLEDAQLAAFEENK